MPDEESSALDTTPRFIRCRYCGQRNQVREEQEAEARCGRCRLLLSDAPHKKFAALNKDQYVHPADRRALAALRAIPGLDTLFSEQGRDFQKNYDEKALDRFWADIITAGLSHPFLVWRVSEILKWVENGEYQTVMNAPESAAA